MIDLHTHTNESDGSFAPRQLVEEAVAMRLEALAITDHDTLSGYDAAAGPARELGLDLVCGIEMSTKLNSRVVHLLGYFVGGEPKPEFRAWLSGMQESRRDRNIRMAARLRELGIDITVEDAERKGRSMTGRPHFAKVMVEKGYVASIQQAFDDYLDESAKGYVDRKEPTLAEGIERIQTAGGLSSIAHPIRIGRLDEEELKKLVGEMKTMGLGALEVYHSDHQPRHVGLYLELARTYDLKVTGGSDFHGEVKPGVKLGIGAGNLNIPRSVLDRMRAS